MQPMITLEDGRVFPAFDSEALSWSIGLYHTWAERELGYPRMRAVIRAMLEHRPAQIRQERSDLVRAQFDPMFGRNAKAALAVVEEEMRTFLYRPGQGAEMWAR